MSDPVPAAVSSPRLHLDFLDGMRALAAMFVVVTHLYTLVFGTQARTHWPLSLANGLLYGHLAVSVFIVISGFCLTLPTLRSRQLARGATDFYWRRARRILPPYFVALALPLILVTLGANTGSETPVELSHVFINALLLQDFAPNANSINFPLWSVAVECHIYFLFPLLLWVWRRFGLTPLLFAGVLMAALATLVWPLIWREQSWRISCPWFIALFVFGMAAAALAHGQSDKSRLLASFVVVAAAALTGVLLWRHPIQGIADEPFLAVLPWIDSALGALVAALLGLLALPTPRLAPLKRALEWRPLVWLGSFAYSLYLTHYFLMHIVLDTLKLVPRINDSRALQTLAMFGIGLPVLIGSAYVFFLFCERPFLSRRAKAAIETG